MGKSKLKRGIVCLIDKVIIKSLLYMNLSKFIAVMPQIIIFAQIKFAKNFVHRISIYPNIFNLSEFC